MKNFILALLLVFVSTHAYAGGNDLLISQRNSVDTSNVTRLLPFPGGSAHSVLVMNGSTVLPVSATLDGGITFDGTKLTTSAIPQANVSGLVTDLSGKVDKVSGKGLSTEDFSSELLSKLNGIASGATANDTDANLKNRSNHTGTQSADTITDGTTNKAFTATEKTKLSGIASGATANDTDANLKARANHTGTQAISTVSGLQTALDAITSRLDVLEARKTAIEISKLKIYSLTTNGSGEFSQSISGFTAPKAMAAVISNSSADTYTAVIGTVSTSSITGRVFKTKTTAVLLGGTIDPDELVGSGAAVTLIVYDPS